MIWIGVIGEQIGCVRIVQPPPQRNIAKFVVEILRIEIEAAYIQRLHLCSGVACSSWHRVRSWRGRCRHLSIRALLCCRNVAALRDEGRINGGGITGLRRIGIALLQRTLDDLFGVIESQLTGAVALLINRHTARQVGDPINTGEPLRAKDIRDFPCLLEYFLRFKRELRITHQHPRNNAVGQLWVFVLLVSIRRSHQNLLIDMNRKIFKARRAPAKTKCSACILLSTKIRGSTSRSQV